MNQYLTTRTLPPRNEYSPLYTGRGVSVYIPAMFNDVETITSISPDAKVVTYSSLDEIFAAHDYTKMGVLVINALAKITQKLIRVCLRANLLCVVPAGYQNQDISKIRPPGYAPYLVVGSINFMGDIALNSNHGKIDLFAFGEDQTVSTLTVAAAAAQFIEMHAAKNIESLKTHIITSATHGMLGKVWPPYDPEIPEKHNRYDYNRVLYVPSVSDPCVWVMPKNLGPYGLGSTYTEKLCVHDSVHAIEAIRDLVDWPDFVSLQERALQIDVTRNIHPGGYQFWIGALVNQQVYKHCFTIWIKAQESDIQTGAVVYVSLDGEYIEINNSMSSIAGDFN